MRCRELMEREVVTARIDTPVTEVAKLMQTRQIGIVPVCDDQRRVLGTITDRDLAVRVLAAGLRAEATSARDVMSDGPITCDPDDDIAVAQERMAHHKKGRILCVDRDGRLVGLVSIADTAQVEPAERTGNVFRALTSRETAFVIW